MSRQRRMLWATVSTSLKVNSLSLKAALLWTWAISHFDDEGFQEGHPKALKGKVVPMRDDISEAEIPALTEEIVKQGLWILHRCKSPTGCEQIYIQDPVFDDKQDLNRTKRELSKIRELLGMKRIAWAPPPSEKTRLRIYNRDGYACVYCETDLKDDPHRICLDHVIPISKGGANTFKNLATSCKVCNAKKYDKTPSEAFLPWPEGLGEKEEMIWVDPPVNPTVDGGADQQNRTELNRTKKKRSSCPNFSEDSDQVRLSKLLLGKIRERKPDYQPKLSGKGIQRWAKDMDFLIRIDKKEPSRIREVIEWCQGDSFWQNNILSPEKLRKQFDQLELKMGTPAPDPYESLPRATKERERRERERHEKKDGTVFRPITDFKPEDSG